MPKLKIFKAGDRVRLTNIEAERIWVFSQTLGGNRIIPALPTIMPCAAGTERLLFTGAKLYRDKSGFSLMGYSHDGSDVRKVLEAVNLA